MVTTAGFKWQVADWVGEGRDAGWVRGLGNLWKVKRGLEGEKTKAKEANNYKIKGYRS